MSAAKGNEEDPTWHLIFLFGIILLLGWLVWHFFRTEILETVRYLRLGEMWLVGLFKPTATACYNWLRIAPVGEGMPSSDVYKWAMLCFGEDNLAHLPPEVAQGYYNLTPASVRVVADLTAPYIKWPALLICLGLGVHAMFFSIRNQFKTRYNLESFIKVQAKMWPVITPIINFNPTKHSARSPGQAVPDTLPLFAEALSPEEWLSFHRIPVVNGIPDRDAVRRAFAQQLGPRWQGELTSLPPYMMALCAAFALRGAQKREESDELLGRLAQCWTPEHGFSMSWELAAEVRKIALDPEVGGKALAAANGHAYRTTAMLRILKWARMNGGVLAPAQFVWVRGADRALWYPLNNLGRRAFHSEGAGAMAHFMAEEAAQKPLPMPRLDTAIVTINQYLAQTAAKIPPREEAKRK